MKRRTCTVALMALSFIQLVQAGEGGTSRRIAPPRRIPDVIAPQSLPAGEPVAISRVPRAVRRAVVADAARRFEVSESAVVLGHAEQVTWSDGSLGCPTPGRMYTQALVPGYLIAATTPAGEMRYHADARGNVVTCDTLPRQRALPVEPGAPRQGATARHAAAGAPGARPLTTRPNEKAPAVSPRGPSSDRLGYFLRKMPSVANVAPPRLAAPKSLLVISRMPVCGSVPANNGHCVNARSPLWL